MNKEARLKQLRKRLSQQQKQLEDILHDYGCGTKYHNKEMAIEETEILISHYEKAIEEDKRRSEKYKQYAYCIKIECDYYVDGKCWAQRIPESDSCKFLEEE